MSMVIKVPYGIGEGIKWRCDDDGKVRTSKVYRVECEIDENGPVFTYYVRIGWKGGFTSACVTDKDIVV